MAVTTSYRATFVPPATGNELLKAVKQSQTEKCKLYCQTKQKPPIIPKRKEVQWTNVCPMGLLIERKLIPDVPPEETNDYHTNNNQQRKFTKDNSKPEFIEIVKKMYPDVYERWLNWPQIKWQMDISRNKTSYNSDYIPIELKAEDEIPNIDKYQDLNNIMETTLPPECRDYYKPFNINYNGCNSNVRNEDNYGPYLFDPDKKIITEYRDKISRNGCTIMKNKIHIHTKACLKACIHKILECK